MYKQPRNADHDRRLVSITKSNQQHGSCYRFCSVSMSDREKVLEFSSRIRQLHGKIMYIGVTIENSEMEMDLLNGLHESYDIISRRAR